MTKFGLNGLCALKDTSMSDNKINMKHEVDKRTFLLDPMACDPLILTHIPSSALPSTPIGKMLRLLYNVNHTVLKFGL